MQETLGPGNFQAVLIAGLRLLLTPGQIHLPSAGSIGQFQQAPAVVHQLQAFPGRRGTENAELETRKLARLGGHPIQVQKAW